MSRPLRYLLVTTLLGGCSLAPDFALPEMPLPASFKEQPSGAQIKTPQGQWAEAALLEKSERGQWWKIFGDDRLNELQIEAAAANQSLIASAARVKQARATAGASASTFFPTVTLGGNAVRAQPSSAGTVAFGGPAGIELNPYTLYSAGATASYEVDLFGRVRDNERALLASAEAQEALYYSTLLMLQSDVAQAYFSLRALDAERALLRDAINVREEAARIMQRRFELGEAGEQDQARTVAELASTQAELIALNRRRAVLEHALAVLLGKMPSEFMFAEAPLEAMPPEIPAGLPSHLLLRRPDVGAAVNAMQAANARIGVARTAFFPQLTLTASGGFESAELSDLFLWSSRNWALGQLGGSALAMTLFDSGRNLARLDVAHAAYEESVASYRQQALVAFRDVEDNLSDQLLLAEQSLKQDAAAQAATRTFSLTQLRYDEGDANYFEVVDAQRNSLAAERAALQTRGQRFITTVSLVRALGGGWDTPEETAP
jgi:outer membrane protein, multidrug efflux system